MATNYQPAPGDSLWNLTYKLIKGLWDGVFTLKLSGTITATGSDTIADGTALGNTAALTTAPAGTERGLIVRLLAGVGAFAAGAFKQDSIGIGAVSAGAISLGAFAANSISAGAIGAAAVATGAFSTGAGTDGWDVTQGTKGDAAITNPAVSASLISLLKGLLTQLSGTGSLATVTTVTTVSALTTGSVGGFTTVIKDTTAVSTSPAYSAGDAVGAKRTIANAVKTSGTGILESITILDRSNQKAAMTLFIFDADPTNATITDNAAFVFSTDDLKVIAQVNIAAADYVTTNSKAIAQKTGLGVALKAASGTSLYAALVTTGTPTYAATSDVQLEYGILQDA